MLHQTNQSHRIHQLPLKMHKTKIVSDTGKVLQSFSSKKPSVNVFLIIAISFSCFMHICLMLSAFLLYEINHCNQKSNHIFSSDIIILVIESNKQTAKKYYNEWRIFNSVKTFVFNDYSDRQHTNSVDYRVSTK
jgi:hypothetical protein